MMKIKSIKDAKTVLQFLPRDRTLRVYTNEDYTQYIQFGYLSRDRMSHTEIWHGINMTGNCSLDCAATRLYKYRKWYNSDTVGFVKYFDKEGLK